MSTIPTDRTGDVSDGSPPFPYRHEAGASLPTHEMHRLAAAAARARLRDEDFARWTKGFGAIRHDDQTQLRVRRLVHEVALEREPADASADVWRLFAAADRLASAAMWLVVHMSYARKVRLDGEPVQAGDFKKTPEGHVGGSLNMVPAYVGYLLANALTGRTRSWLMGQGHSVAAIEAVNALTSNLHPEQSARYDVSDTGLSRLCADFYSYAIDADGEPGTPLGSHVNAHTAGGLIEGGYLGFAELQYVHMPMPGETLVAFLSDGSFEEQRGADWAPRWWRAQDTGLAVPIMILNGRRIEQRSSMEQDGGVAWFTDHLRLNGFDPIVIDGTDPAAFAWAILEAEARLAACAAAAHAGALEYPAALHYTIAQAPKGYGFPGAGTNLSHNLPLGANPALDEQARTRFNEAARELWVPPDELSQSLRRLANHESQRRPLERDHPLAVRDVRCEPAELPWCDADSAAARSPMSALDQAFVALAQANPMLRVRIGNPDELRSNGMARTLEHFRHRVADPEANVPEAVDGAVITALNEEAVVCAALANKAGLNLVVSYEAFAVKMLGAMRQELTFARGQARVGRAPRWLSVPIVVSSHTWENGKNELSHQDPTLSEAWMAEPPDRARVVFPPDWNTALACMDASYRTHGQIWVMVVPKRPVPTVLNEAQARQLAAHGMLRLVGSGAPEEKLVLIAIGSYQLVEVLRASERLVQHGVAHAVVVVVEPGRFKSPHDSAQAAATLTDHDLGETFPEHSDVRIVVSHTRPEPITGVLRRIDTGARRTSYLGFINRGGTLDTFGMLFANRCTWGHVLVRAAETMGLQPEDWLTAPEWAAVLGHGDPDTLR
jgi:phosphoketolase